MDSSSKIKIPKNLQTINKVVVPKRSQKDIILISKEKKRKFAQLILETNDLQKAFDGAGFDRSKYNPFALIRDPEVIKIIDEAHAKLVMASAKKEIKYFVRVTLNKAVKGMGIALDVALKTLDGYIDNEGNVIRYIDENFENAFSVIKRASDFLNKLDTQGQQIIKHQIEGKVEHEHQPNINNLLEFANRLRTDDKMRKNLLDDGAEKYIEGDGFEVIDNEDFGEKI